MVFPRAMLVSVAVFGMLQIAPLGVASGSATFEEHWSAGPNGWTFTNPGIQIVQETPYLHIDPPCCSYDYALRHLGVQLTGAADVAFSFRASSTAGNSDSLLRLELGDDRSDLNDVDLGLTGGPSNNHAWIGNSPTNQALTTGEWPSANEWYEIRAHLDPAAMTAVAQLYSVDGTLLGTSPSFSISSTYLGGVSIHSAQWTSGDSLTFDYDAIRVTDDMGLILTEDWSAGQGAWSFVNAGVTIVDASQDYLHIDPPCCAYNYASKVVDAPISLPTEASFRFRASATGGNSDTVLRFELGNDASDLNDLDISFTGEPGNQVAWIGNSQRNDVHPIGSWPTPRAWYSIVLHIEPIVGVVQADLIDSSGHNIGRSAPILVSSLYLRAISIHSAQWAPSDQTTFDYDDIVVQPTLPDILVKNLTITKTKLAGAPDPTGTWDLAYIVCNIGPGPSAPTKAVLRVDAPLSTTGTHTLQTVTTPWLVPGACVAERASWSSTGTIGHVEFTVTATTLSPESSRSNNVATVHDHILVDV
ncbi:MAG: hypothetical protein WDA16_14080 [Candidatus Thermoplasmatota archaeon]